MSRVSQGVRTTKLLGILVALVGAAVMLGWVFDIGVLKSIRPDWVTMKFSTAFCFFMSGITLYYIACLCSDQPSFAYAVLPAALLCIALTMFTLLASTLFDIYVGIEVLFIKERVDAVETVMPGRPSVGTMLAFMLIVFAGITAMLKPANLSLYLAVLGMGIFLSGLSAAIGYAVDAPLLYFYIQEGGLSSAMALHTAILFMLIGIGLVRLK